MRALLLMAALPLAAADFARDVKPVLERACVGCHGPAQALGGLRLDTRERALRVLAPGKPEGSLLLRSVELASGEKGAMPPGGPPLKPEERRALREWIAAGAPWPEGTALQAPAAAKKMDERAVVEAIAKRIGPAGEFQAYRQTIPGTAVSYEMVPVPGGEFSMGTPETEAGRNPDEGPVRRVKVEPFWMGKFEVTWDEYRLFMFAQQANERAGEDPALDAVSRPTRPYVEMSFGMGINGYPAISMTQHAANKYAEWLSAKTGHFYRLPTEAEWEYACRAGSSAAYSFGADASKLGEYAWFEGNANGKYEKVGTKKPNAWGLHDMHGNVMEWTLDQYDAEAYSKDAAWTPSTKPYPHVVRGGSWNDPAEMLRCGARLGSDPSWKMQDPQLPKSVWYHTDAQWLGFRLVRPRKTPPAEEMYRYWNNGVELDP